MNEPTTPKKFVIRMMYKTELAAEYGVSVKHIKTMLAATSKHLKKQNANKDVFGEYTGRRLLTIAQIKMCIQHNGLPYE